MAHTVLLADPMPGVRDGLRWVLAGAADIVVVGEADTVAAAARADADVVVSGLRLADGTAADLVTAAGRPVVVHTWLPADERADVDCSGAAAVVRHGRLRAELPAAIRSARRRRPSPRS